MVYCGQTVHFPSLLNCFLFVFLLCFYLFMCEKIETWTRGRQRRQRAVAQNTGNFDRSRAFNYEIERWITITKAAVGMFLDLSMVSSTTEYFALSMKKKSPETIRFHWWRQQNYARRTLNRPMRYLIFVLTNKQKSREKMIKEIPTRCKFWTRTFTRLSLGKWQCAKISANWATETSKQCCRPWSE